MAQSLMDFFAGTKLTQLMTSEAIKRGVPRKLPASLFNPSLSKPSTDQVEYIQVSSNRQAARAVARSSPARARELPGASRKFATAVNFKESMSISIEMFDALKNTNPIIANNARQQLVRDYANFRSLFENARTATVASAFANGKVWIDGDGNLLASSAGAKITVDYGIGTGNQITKNGAGSTYNIGDWSDASTDLGAATRALKTANVKANGYELTTILYGTNVPSHLAKNTTMKEYFKLNPAQREAIATNQTIPNGTLAFNWVPVETMFFVDKNNAATSWFDPNFIGVMPDIEDSWYEFVEGGNLVPNGVASTSMTLDQMVELCSVVNGMYSYSVMSLNPLSCELIMGDSHLPLIKVPGTYYFGTCG